MTERDRALGKREPAFRKAPHRIDRLASLLAPYERLRSGSPAPGDNFAILRGLYRIACLSSDARDLVQLAAQAGRFDEEASSAVQLILASRPTSERLRRSRQAEAAQRRRLEQQSVDGWLYIRVLDYVDRHRCTLSQAYKAVANCEDGWLSSLQPRRRVLSSETATAPKAGADKVEPTISSEVKVKKAYEAERRRATKVGYVQGYRGLLAGIQGDRPLPLPPKIGRPKKG